MALIRTILASTSPSRRMVLRNAGIEPVLIAPNFDEDSLLTRLDSNPSLTPADKVCALARGKAGAVLGSKPSDEATTTLAKLGSAGQPTVVIACDSMLLLDGHLSGKPHTVDEAIRRWHLQKGRTAELITGHAIIGVGLPGSPLSGSTLSGGALSGSATNGFPTQTATKAASTTNEPSTQIAIEAISTKVHFGNPSDADIEAYARSGEPLGCAGAFTLEAKGGWFIDGIDGDPSSVLGISLPLIQRTLHNWGVNISDTWEEPNNMS